MENQTNQSTATAKSTRKLPAFFNVGNALKLTCVGFAAGIVLRVVQMLYFYDYETGFYTDGGLVAAFSLGVPLLTAVIGGIMCYASPRYFGSYLPRKNIGLGVISLLSGAALLTSALMQLLDYFNYLATGVSAYDSTRQSFIHIAFLICCFLYGTVQLFAAVGFLQGRSFLRKMPLLYLVGTAWGVSYVVLVYVFYAKSSSLVENLFAVGGGATTLLSVFYLCKLFAGVDEEDAAKRQFISGIFAVVLTVPYAFSNLVLMLLGKSYSGEIPFMVQLSSLGVSLFLLVFMMTFRRGSVHRLPKDPTQREQTAPIELPKRFRAD